MLTFINSIGGFVSYPLTQCLHGAFKMSQISNNKKGWHGLESSLMVLVLEPIGSIVGLNAGIIHNYDPTSRIFNFYLVLPESRSFVENPTIPGPKSQFINLAQTDNDWIWRPTTCATFAWFQFVNLLILFNLIPQLWPSFNPCTQDPRILSPRILDLRIEDPRMKDPRI